MGGYMPLANYREVPIILNGKELSVGGFERPDESSVFTTLRTQHNVGAVVSLTGDGGPGGGGDYTPFVVQGGLKTENYTHGKDVAVSDWFSSKYEESQRIDPMIYDNIYAAVESAQEKGLKIAIHCGSGDGRTGTALATLKLRELLEADAKDPTTFDMKQQKSEKIFLRHGAPGTGGQCCLAVTPLVKAAIDHVRRFDNLRHESVESVNDVESILLYERHLRAQFVLKRELRGGIGNIKESKLNEKEKFFFESIKQAVADYEKKPDVNLLIKKIDEIKNLHNQGKSHIEKFSSNFKKTQLDRFFSLYEIEVQHLANRSPVSASKQQHQSIEAKGPGLNR